YPSSKQFVLN
ncbi:unnamed protein product, partial [Allacma fusca]